ncbi:CBS domain-containing protein [Streptomyces sp. NPDC006678]|uniref:CBS domain-containing protein n=1 Tax=Streptomyces sp. NPDC006678 TaxID=3157185 RepID=UPI00340ADD15
MERSRVGAVMTGNVITAQCDASFKEVAHLLHEHCISGLPVVDDDERVIGVISETDLLARQVEADDPYRPPRRFHWPRISSASRRRRIKAHARTAGQLMSRPVVTVGADVGIADAARTMAKHGVERLPVVDAEQHLVGIVTRHDLLQIFLRGDNDILREVMDEVFVRTLSLPPQAVSITVREGVVTLTGELEHRPDAEIAMRTTHKIDGVVAVDNQLTFRLDDAQVRLSEPGQRGVADDWLRKL